MIVRIEINWDNAALAGLDGGSELPEVNQARSSPAPYVFCAWDVDDRYRDLSSSQMGIDEQPTCRGISHYRHLANRLRTGPASVSNRHRGSARRVHRSYSGPGAGEGAVVPPGRLVQDERRCANPEDAGAEALRKAWIRFEERTRRSLSTDPPPAERMAEIANIAESIINALLPDDADNRREVIDDDYRRQSDVETFAQLIGKVIQFNDDLPTLRDEIVMEDVDRSV
jgi:hypothetical protein